MATTPVQAPGGRGRQYVQNLDDLLRCGICFDYFNIAMVIPHCSHNYCSLCIRKFLSYKTQCPTCCVAVTESDLRNNRILDDLVKTFCLARQHLSQSILDSPPVSPQHQSTGKLDVPASQGPTGKTIKKENKLMDVFLVKTSTPSSKRTLKASSNVPSISTPIIKLEEEAPSLIDTIGPTTPSTSAMKVHIKVECPVCSVGISEQYINKHLDSCLTRDEKKDSLRSSVQKRKTMAKVVYNLLSDRDLRKRLKEIGLSTHGTKQQMIRRHQEFVQMYNAQCDSLNPKSVAEIVCEIENNEKTRSALEAKQESGMTFSKEQTEREIDEIHQKYRKKHKNEFQQLIQQMKGRWAKTKGKQNKMELSEDCKISTENVVEEEDVESDMKPSADNDLVKSDNVSIVRSDSPVFPLSAASSSSDILRDLDEMATRDELEPSIASPMAKARKRKASSLKETPGKRETLRSKRHRK
ncbi:E3 ubiquitin- ligase RAD18 isoform X3 [Pelobates cultripes]|uniref:RING-type E3 ubiquitin transferase n=1 Tax=Pelobates cultripes TaxID=61616 RepID=A0AAD1SWE6_PELCU|nr:E3 ubiquitin- ligase RAD18 isoform X3 [Pelobates cultripes]